MIYRVVLDNTMDIHTPDNPLLNPSVELEMNSAGSFNFTLPPDHPAWDEVKVLKTTIDVYEDNELIFTGRVANIDKNWNNERVVECEGALAYFNDSIQRQNKWADPLPIAVDPDDQPEDPAEHIQNFLEDVLNNHNTFVPENRRIYMGHIYIDHCDVTREVDYDTTLDVLTRMCIDTNGGWFMIRKDSTDHKLYLDWLKDFTQESDQKAQFGLNLLNFDSGVHAEDVCTGVLAKGADVDDQTIMLNDVELVDPTTYPEMSVTHYTDHDQDILWHREGVKKFGEIVQVHDFSDAEIAWKDQQGQIVANSLFEMARKWLEDKNTKIETIEVEVADLGWLDEGVPVFRLGQIVELNDAPHMTGEAMRKLPMYKISCDLNSGSKKVTLGTPPKKELTQISASNSDADTLSTGSTASGSGSSSGGSSSKDGIKDVKVNGTSVVDDGVANVSVPTDYVTTSTYNSGMATKASVTSVENLATAVGILDTTVQGKQDAIAFNTQEAATEHLTKLKANGVVYDIPGGGGSANINSGTADPSGGNDGDLYLKVSTTSTDQDVFGTPVSNTGDDYEISTDVTIYSTYDAYKAFGTGDGWGKNGQGNANLIYHFKNGKKAKIKSLTYCNNFNVSGGYLCSWFTFYGSNDGTNWTQLYNTNSTTVRDATATATISTDTYYEYFKFACNYTSGYTGLKGIVCIGDIQTVDPGIEDIFFKDNGVWLKDKFIKDADSFVYLPTLYSEEEREVGVWTDGKPLYQRTFIKTANQRNSDWTEFGTISTDVDTVVYMKGIVDYVANSAASSGPLEEDYISVHFRRSTGKIYYYCGTALPSRDVPIIITIQYTKTTDTPGSGTWTPEGQLAHHYSTSEKIVGTWIDGSTIYERTWDLGSDMTGSGNTWIDMRSYISTIPNCNLVLDAKSMTSDGVSFPLDGAYNAGYLELRHPAQNWNGRYITIQYTKSS